MLKILTKIKLAPAKPGIYLFYNKNKELIYVGKATSLKSRIRSYFADFTTRFTSVEITSGSLRPIETLIHEVSNVKWIITDSVLEAIILEANYIKKFQPKYNVLGKDDKSWNYLYLTNDQFPTLKTIRNHELNKIKEPIAKSKEREKEQRAKIKDIKQATKDIRALNIWGPFPGLNIKETFKILRKLFNYSDCKPGQKKPCFYNQIEQCLGVCTGEITAPKYKQKVIKPLSNFLSGRKDKVILDLAKAMKVASREEEYEEAGRIRDQIKNLKKIKDIALLNDSFFKPESTLTTKSPLTFNKIEGYDISNLGATGKVGSLVTFINGVPDKKNYKKFKIKKVQGQSDVDCLAEVLQRRFQHHDWQYPDLILVDGGKPQISTTQKTIKNLQITIPIVGIAKGQDRKKNQFFITDQRISSWVKENKKLLIQVRDEAHRFAIKYQRQLRKIK